MRVEPFLVAFGVAAAVTPVLARAASAAGLVDRPAPGALKIHARPIPLSGGVGVAAATLAALAVWGWPRGLVVLAGSAALVVGLVDDVRPMSPWARVALLGGVGALLVAGGVSLGPAGPWGAAGTVLVTLACANAANILDGQDGLVPGLGAIAALGLAALGVQAGASQATALGVALAGSLAGFLLWNRPPARVFLGDGGAYAVGALLAVMAADVAVHAGWEGLLAAGMCLGVFAFELTFSTLRRLGTGSLVRGDRLHSYDLVSARLGDRWRATLLFWGGGAACALAAQAVGAVPLPVGAIVAALAAVGAGVWGIRLWSGVPREVS